MIMSFKYHKENGEVSDRVFIPIQYPTDKYFGVDITELDIEDQVPFAMALEEIIDEQKERIEQLMLEYDVKHNYRFFFGSKMTEVKED